MLIPNFINKADPIKTRSPFGNSIDNGSECGPSVLNILTNEGDPLTEYPGVSNIERIVRRK